MKQTELLKLLHSYKQICLIFLFASLILDEIKPLASSSGSAPENEDFTFTKAERKEELTALSLFKKISEPLKKQ